MVPMTAVDTETQPVTVLLQPGSGTPNNPSCPVLHYRHVAAGPAEELAEAFETLFTRHGWPPAWRNGVFPYHHFHTTAHEALGVYAGQARVMLGGEGGIEVTMAAGDVVVIPAGVGHCKLECDGRLGIVGAYPRGQHPDLGRPDPDRMPESLTAVAAVPMPAMDPVQGPQGELVRRWSAATAR